MSTPASPTSAPTRLLIAGFGKLGSRLGERYLARGAAVVGVRRSADAAGGGIRLIRGDLADPTSFPPSLPDADALVITLPPPSVDRVVAPDAYRRSLETLAARLPRIPDRVVFVSSTRVFEGRADGAEITEADAPSPMSDRARALVDGERRAVELLGASVIRPSGIYGPGRDSLLRRVLEGDPVQYARRTKRVHESDLVRAIEAMLERADAPSLLHATDAHPAPLGEVATFVAGELGVAPPPRIHPEEASGTLLSGERMLQLLGTLDYPGYREGYAEMVRLRST
ncbi:nucleoside-diphosphate-sugar epimerase [Pseudoclavibacter sp. JAI123]|uniref:sugar nucleotide-binding protein n=1 Tax=Pseudoclavibacter sp. JAI123 TaxID=2723065 RepID=UPI0015CC4B37|nr:sugar nucleotide-binding protein [Pseudoclavibacter sp. JAI123]NYF12611.1 nucleoside-diphosphate-sugar epimerase [Pseudoclavibacter sp. JAI123]